MYHDISSIHHADAALSLQGGDHHAPRWSGLALTVDKFETDSHGHGQGTFVLFNITVMVTVTVTVTVAVTVMVTATISAICSAATISATCSSLLKYVYRERETT